MQSDSVGNEILCCRLNQPSLQRAKTELDQLRKTIKVVNARVWRARAHPERYTAAKVKEDARLLEELDVKLEQTRPSTSTRRGRPRRMAAFRNEAVSLSDLLESYPTVCGIEGFQSSLCGLADSYCSAGRSLSFRFDLLFRSIFLSFASQGPIYRTEATACGR